MLPANVAKRMCGFAISSGTNWERNMGPEGGKYGVMESILDPILGKVVRVTGYSFGSRCSSTIARL